MQVIINGDSYRFENRLSIEQILSELKISTEQGVAVAVNEVIILRTQLSSTFINEGDKLEIIHATAGG